MTLDNLPFHIGATAQVGNPAGLPNTWPFSLYYNEKRGAIMQLVTPELVGVLADAYRAGQLIGTPLNGDSCGKPYADDFLRFIAQLALPRDGRAIEIGAGVGYLTRRLKEMGLRIVGIEPGRGYSAHWEENGVEIVNEFFPTEAITGKFDLICGYALLEHITEPIRFLENVRDRLAPKGVAVFSVPDCTDELVAGDPAILYHEHVSYFDAGSLKRLIESVGMRAFVVKSGFGRCLYVVGSLTERPALHSHHAVDRDLIASYPERCISFVDSARKQVSKLASKGMLGVYCASRGLALLDGRWPMRFFDDDPALLGKFLPPFSAPIEGLDSLLARPVEAVVVMSRTFGERIRNNLKLSGYKGGIFTLDELRQLA